MTPAARLQAAIDILDEVFAAVRQDGPAADVIVARYFRQRRYAGAKDRAAVRDLVFTALRTVPTATGASGRKAMLGLDDAGLSALFGAAFAHAPAAASCDEQADATAWMQQPDSFVESLGADAALLASLRARAPLDLRVNTLRTTRDAVLEELSALGAVPTPLSPLGIRLLQPIPIEQHPCFTDGSLDIQDEGSQLVALACEARPGDMVIDLCAGGGGKSLALATIMQNSGCIIASDISPERLARLAPRAARLGISCIETAPPEGLQPGADIVLVDAPCTGSGTWRRNPEARLRLNPDYLERMRDLQSGLLDRATALVRPGGRIVYAVCSWITAEGDEQISAALSRHPGLRMRSCRTLRPDREGCDGFFIACLENPC